MATVTQAMVLAAGRGTRLGRLGEQVAKALVEIDGRPLLAQQLDYLAGQGMKRVVVNASHLAEQLEEFASRYRGPIELEIVVEDEPLGTAGGVVNALPRLSGEPLLVLYGDVVVREDLRPMSDQHERERPAATLAVYQDEGVEDKGIVETEGSRVIGFVEKDPDVTSGLVNGGIYVVDPAWLEDYSGRLPLDFGHDVFPDALANGEDLRAYALADPVLDIGTPPDLAKARERRSD